MKKSSQETQNYYDGISTGYSQLYHDEQKQKTNLVKSFFLKKGLILDLGSGDGVLNTYFKNKIISCDLSFNLLKLNKNSFKVQANVLKLPFKSEIFDQVISFTMLQDVSNPKIAIKEIKRVLKRKGILIISFLKISSNLKIIEKELKKYFKIIYETEEVKDKLFVLEKK